MADVFGAVPVLGLLLSAGTLLGAVLLITRRSLRLILGCVVTSVVALHAAYAASLTSEAAGVGAFTAALAAGVCLAAALLAGTQHLLCELEHRKTPRAHWVWLGLLVVGAQLCLRLPGAVVAFELDGHAVPGVGRLGQAVIAGVLLSFLFVISTVEQLLRRLRDPLRYQLKFLLIGFGALAVAEVHTLSLLLLEGAWQTRLAVTHIALNSMSLMLVMLGVWRLRAATTWSPLSPSAGAYGSLSLFIVAGYLVAMGLTAEVVPRRTASHLVLGASAVFAALLTLAVLLSSRTLRAKLRRSFVRAFKRSKHDYRSKWLELNEAFLGVASQDKILDRFIDLLGNTFGARRISIWLLREADGNLYQTRSVNIEVPAHGLSAEHPLVSRLLEKRAPLLLSKEEREADDFCREMEVSLVAALGASSLAGLVVLSEETAGPGYDQDDVDLLQTMTSHTGLLLEHSKLAEAHQADAEMRALHEFSMFCMHDLKNLAGRLSLVAQNAKRFGDNPEFQSSALRTVSTTVERMTQLIRKLSRGAQVAHDPGQPNLRADLFEGLAQAVATLKGGIELRLPEVPHPRPRVKFEQGVLGNVLLNLVTNAEQAMPEGGTISVTHRVGHAEHILCIRDDGPGITPEALASLFKPFRSTKRGGAGIGLYQCKSTVEAFGGKISVQSELGHGTCVELRLPSVTVEQEGSAA